MSDVIVIGAGPNGLVAANILADAGLDVLVCEAQDEPGGAVRSGELTLPGFVHDKFSAFYPLAAASPVMQRLDLEQHGLRWRRSPLALAHPTAEGPTAVLSTDPEETAASLEAFSPGDGQAWRDLYSLWERVGGHFMDAFATPFPPVRASMRMAAALGPSGTSHFLRMAAMPVRRFADETFNGNGGAHLLAGNALHADLTPDSVGGALFGWILCSLGQQLGFPVPEGGAGMLTAALVRRLQKHGGVIMCDARVETISIHAGRVRGVRLADGREIPARRGVLADVGAPQLYMDLVGREHLPARMVRDLRRFQYDNSTIKLDWALSQPIPWASPEARRAGTIHVADSIDLLTETTTQLEMRLIPERPFLVLGQYAPVDPTRSPDGKEVAWAYTHVPQRTKGDSGGALTGRWDAGDLDLFAQRMESEVERLAPGFGDCILARNVLGPRELEAMNANLVNGAVNGGTAKVHQQLVFRPVPGLGRPETPVAGLYLASASAHPGGGVHGVPGANAARAFLTRQRMKRGLAVAAAGTAAWLLRPRRD
jgi:phytoene dehydrogenase-like protein